MSARSAATAVVRQWKLLLALDAAAAKGLTFDQITASGACSERTARQDVDTLILAGFPVEVRTESQPRVFLDRASWQCGEGTIFNRQGH